MLFDLRRDKRQMSDHVARGWGFEAARAPTYPTNTTTKECYSRPPLPPVRDMHPVPLAATAGDR